MKRKRRRAEDDGLAIAVMELAWISPTAGFVVTAIFLVVGMVLNTMEYGPGSSMFIIGPFLSIICGLLGAVTFLVSTVALIRDEFNRS